MINCHRGSQTLHRRCPRPDDTAHQLDVTAETLYEAVAQALAMVRGHDWVGDIGTGLTTVTVKVRNPQITHIVKIQDFESWLNRGLQEPGRHGSENEAAAHAGDETIIRMVRRARRFAGRALLALAGLTEPRVSAIR
jgi:hypothetical protein